VPIGGGSGACGILTARNALSPTTKVIGVGAVNADAVARSWRGPARVVGTSARTFAEGMATRVTFDLTFDILQRYLDDFVLLTEEQLAEGVRVALSATHNLAEGAGAAALMAALLAADTHRGRRVVAVMSGGNMDAPRLSTILAGGVPS
jgi:threonine dehydratase